MQARIVRALVATVALIGAVALGVGAAEAKRVALVIGNQHYSSLVTLQTTLADSSGYADALKAKGFDQVILKQDLTRPEMDEAVADFVDAIEPGDIAVFAYAGHGWSDGSQNYIVGTDAPAAASEERLARIAIPIANGANGVVDEMTRKGASLKVAIIDACRDNPFKAAVAGRGIGLSRGFNRLAQDPPDGTFLIFSAGSGQTALDRLSDSDPDPNGVFTRTFLPLLRSDRPLLQAVKATQTDVFKGS